MKIIGKIPFTLESKTSPSRWARQSLVLGCSLDLLKDPEGLAAFSQEVTDAIQSCVESHWARQSPLLYVMISGVESLPGFEAYFKRLKPEQREQILGFTLPFHQADLKAEFLTLNQQLSARVLSHLNWEATKSADNAEVLFFPQALAEIYSILEGVFSGFKMLRGVYFVTADSIKRIESDVLLKEAQYFKPWAMIFDYAETQRKKIAAIALTGLILLFGVWWLGALKGEAYLSEVTQNLSVSTLPDLQALNQLGVQDDRWFGRYLGILFPNKVKDTIQNQYDLDLRSQFQPMLLAEFAQHLQNNITAGKTKKVTGMDLLTEDAAIYDSLSAYLMLNDLSHFDAHFVAGQIAEPDLLPVYWDWVALGVQSMPINQDLVNQARAILGHQPLSIQAFFALKASASEPPVYLAGQGQNSFSLNHGDTVDGFFTQAASSQYLSKDEENTVMQTLSQSWVLGAGQALSVNQSEISTISAQVTQFYWNQYAQAWSQALAGVSLKPFSSIHAAASWFNEAGHQGSDWMTLWQQMAQNLPSLNAYFSDGSHLAAIQSALSSVGEGLNQGQNNLDLAVQILNGQFAPLNQLQALAESAPQPVQDILKSMVQSATKTVFSEAEKQVTANWQSHVAHACRNVIQQPNPDLDDFSHFFNHSGLGGRFISDHVSSLVNIKSGQLEQRSAYGVPFVLPDFLQQDIVRLILIHDAFFNQSNAPSLSISLKPMVLSKNLADFTIHYGAQTVFYQNGPRFATVWNWPASNGDIVVQFVGLDGQVLTEQYSGPWALIQLFNSVSVMTIDRSHFALTFSKGNDSATYELSLTQGNFAGVLALQGFDCQ